MAKTIAATISALGAALLLSAGSASAAGACSLYAAPGGSDAAAGSEGAPFASVQKLADSLVAGQTGCVRAGAFHEDVTVRQSSVTLTSAPGETAKIIGRLWIPRGADGVTVSDLHLDGVNAQNLPSPTVDGNNATFIGDEVTDEHTAICYDLGSDIGYGTAVGTVITRNRIHDCGVMPARNHDHGIYVESARNTTISWNLIYGNADRGVQLYPDAQNTTISHNVIDGNGEGVDFSGDFGHASNGNQVYANLLTGAKLRYDVESWYPAGNPAGTANTVQGNCIHGGAEGTVDTSSGGFRSGANTLANPRYVNASAGDFHLQAGSPCLAVSGNVAAVVDGSETPAAATQTASAGHAPRAHAAIVRAPRHGQRSKHRRARHHRAKHHRAAR